MDGIRHSLGKFFPLFLVLVSSSEGFVGSSRSYKTYALDHRGAALASRMKSSSSSAATKTTAQLFSTPNNPFASFVGDFAQSIMGKSDIVSVNPNFDANLKSLLTVDWPDIRSQLESVQTPDEKKFRDNLVNGYGEGSPMHKVRLYDESNKESDIRVTFYRDHASWCPYCQKVWFALEEKRIPYRVEKVNMSCYGGT